MKTRRNACVLAAAALVWAGTAAAGTVYLPLAINGALDGKTYNTYVWLTNPGGEPNEIQVRYIERDTTGIDPNASTVTAKLTVGAGQTFKLAVGQAGVGMVELSGPDDSVFSARLESLTPGGIVRSSAHLPLIGSNDVFPAGTVAHVQGGERALSGTASHFGIAAFGGDAGECSIKSFRADGSQVLATATVMAPALGQRWFQDVFNLLQEPSIGDARFEVSCDVPFFPFATILASEPDSTQFVLPSVTAADSLGPTAPGPKAGELVRLNGNFFTAVRGASIYEAELPIAAGVEYDQIVWEFDVFLPRLNDCPAPCTNFHSMTLLLTAGRTGTFFAHTIRGNGKYKTTIDLGDHRVVRGSDGAWAPNTVHHVRVTYDWANRTVTWELFRDGGLVERLVSSTKNQPLLHSGEGMRVMLGLDKEYDHGGYLPPYNARFSNLVVTGVPAGQ
ncbi:MAG TPA: hypothetical protein VF100_02885 [Thermoanaerobaculia bacterium]